jgi:hypothetical protein
MGKCCVFFGVRTEFLNIICILCTMCMKWTHIGLAMSVCPHGSTREQLDGFGQNWYERYAIGDSPKIVLYNFLQ